MIEEQGTASAQLHQEAFGIYPWTLCKLLQKDCLLRQVCVTQCGIDSGVPLRIFRQSLIDADRILETDSVIFFRVAIFCKL